MRTSLVVGGLWLASFGLWMSGCGDSNSDVDNPSAGAAAGNAASGGNGAGHGSGGDLASSGKGGAAAAGTSSNAGHSGTPHDGGATGEGGTGVQPGAGGAESSGGAAGDLVDCDTRKVLCKIAIPECPVNEVISVIGTCYGPCVRIDHCACSSADECPNENEYTCWAKTHCGPYVQ